MLLLPAALVVIGMAKHTHAMDAGSELLPEDEAFSFSAILLPDNSIEATWSIADGYYMYRDKTGFSVNGEAVLGTTNMPPGKPKYDELFGDVEVYTNRLQLKLPIEVAKKGGLFTLVAEGQGCNEPIGVCYPPIRHEIKFTALDPENLALSPNNGGLSSIAPKLEADGLVEFDGMNTSSNTITNLINRNIAGESSDRAPSINMDMSPGTAEMEAAEQGTTLLAAEDQEMGESTDPGQIDSVSELRDLLAAGFDQPEYLAVEDAFRLSIEPADNETLSARFEVAEGYYLYKKKMQFNGSGSATVNQVDLPEGELKKDEYFGETSVFRNSISFPIKLRRLNQQGGEMTVEAVYQGCADGGICYPPVTESIAFTLPALISSANAQEISTRGATGQALAPRVAETTAGSLITLLGGALIAGLLLTFTPCVLPLIPILSSVIAGQGSQLTRMRGGMLALIYVAGTAVTYAAMGALAGATGEQLQAYFQNIWAIGALAIIFGLMALSMFGLFTIQMPAAIQARLQARTSKLSGAALPVFVLGIVSALIVGACVSPVLISFLGVAVSRADPVLGGQMMFVMALGMGIPLIALGFGAGYLIPRAGQWMEVIKHFFGVMLIGVAIYMLGVLPQVPVLLLWGIFFIILSTYLGATQSLPPGSSGWQYLQKGIGMILLVWGVFALLGSFFGQRDILKPLPQDLFARQGQNAVSVNEAHLFTQVTSEAQFEQLLAAASTQGKRVMIDFYADWCIDCIKMEETTFKDALVLQTLSSDYVALQVDVTDPTDPGTRAVKKRLGVFGPPAVLFFDRSGQRQTNKDFYGYKSADEFLSLISG